MHGPKFIMYNFADMKYMRLKVSLWSAQRHTRQKTELPPPRRITHSRHTDERVWRAGLFEE